MWFTLIGLLLEVVGVGFLLREELTGLAAMLKQEDAKKKIVVGSPFQKLPVALAKVFGSRDSLAMESFVIEKFAMRFYGFGFLFLGFVLQVVPVVQYIVGT
jgi:hypothetical protein